MSPSMASMASIRAISRSRAQIRARLQDLPLNRSLVCQGSVGSAPSYATAADGAATAAAAAPAEDSETLIHMEEKYSAHNYHPLPIVFSRASGSHVWDPEGKEYLDFLSAYSAVNQGHGHPRILSALKEQAERVTLSSRAFYNDKFPLFAQALTSSLGYDMMLPMNTGAEAVETALKVAKKWGYEKKGIPQDEALIVSCCGCFHGRTMAAVSMSCDPTATRGFGPMLPGNLKVDFGDTEGLKKIFEEHGKNIAGFLFEPIQGEAGVLLPPPGYLASVRSLCSSHSVLMIADEIQTGLARTGRMLACEWEGVRPDMVTLGKALGAGVLPLSAVLADADVMLCIRPGEHGSTFGGNPLASAVGLAALQVIQEEHLAQRADEQGQLLRSLLSSLRSKPYGHLIKDVRGRGLLNAIEVEQGEMPAGVSAFDLCVALKERGVLAKPTHGTIIRLAPPLNISEDDIRFAVDALDAVFSTDLPLLAQRAAAAVAAAGGKAEEGTPSLCERCGRNVE